MRRVEAGERLSAEPPLRTVSYDSPRAVAVCAFTGLSIVAAPVPPAWVAARVPADDLGAPLCPSFLTALGDLLGRRAGGVDIVMAAPPGNTRAAVRLREQSDATHPRVRRAHRYRDDVRVYTTDGEDGVLILGRGLAGRWEAAVEVSPRARGAGLGRALASAARVLVPEDRAVWAQIAPGNAASVRAFLAAGFQPVGAEALLVPVRG